MKLRILDAELSVCRLRSPASFDWEEPLYFFGKTDRELSLVCRTGAVPEDVEAREDGWRAFRVEGMLDFSLVGVLARMTGVLADEGISVFAVSTFETDYLLVRREKLEPAAKALRQAGYGVVR